MENDLIGIGQLAVTSGLSVSALRFYDSAGVLIPAAVEAHNGYRRYRPHQVAEARLVARLRRVGLPVADIRQVLTLREQPDAALAVLDRHLRRLEDGLADARRELSTVRALLTEENSMIPTSITVPAGQLAKALAAVRFAASTDPALPRLAGVLLDIDAEEAVVRVVATDRYRMAVSTLTPAGISGPSAAVLVSAEFARDAERELAGRPTATVTLAADQDEVTISCANQVITGGRLAHEFPDYRAVLRIEPTSRVTVRAAALRDSVARHPTRTMVREQDGTRYEVSVLSLDDAGGLQVDAPGADENSQVGVNREFLLQALQAAGADQLVLELDAPIGPLAIRNSDDESSFSILMPARLS